MSSFVIGNRVSRGVTMPTATRLELDGSNLVLTSPPRDTRTVQVGGTETVMPMRAVQSLSLELPDKTHCKAVAGMFGMLVGSLASVYLQKQNVRRVPGAVASTAVGAGTTFGTYTLCMQQQAMMTIQTQRDDLKIAIGGDQREDSIRFFKDMGACLKHGAVAANASDFVRRAIDVS